VPELAQKTQLLLFNTWLGSYDLWLAVGDGYSIASWPQLANVDYQT